MKLGIVFALSLFVATTASAGEVTRETFEAKSVSDIVDLCSEPEGTDAGKYAIGFCYGWLKGIDEFYDALLADERFDVKPISCPGRAVAASESRLLFVKWATSTEGALEMPALQGLVRASKEIFPCS